MSFISELRRELAARGVEPRRVRRIVLELEDHLACDPEAKLGTPEEIAERFASELRVAQTRRATVGGFGALALTALLVASTARAVSAAGGWPDLAGIGGVIVPIGGLVAAFAGQVAFVAGVLALWLWLWRPDQLRLVQRRMTVALAAAWVVVAADAVDAIAMRSALPTWWFVFAVAGTTASAAALAAAGRPLRAASSLTPRSLVASATGWRPSWVLAVGVAAVAAMTFGSTLAERSWVEGVFRGGFEVLAFSVGFLALGRALGLRASNVTEVDQ